MMLVIEARPAWGPVMVLEVHNVHEDTRMSTVIEIEVSAAREALDAWDWSLKPIKLGDDIVIHQSGIVISRPGQSTIITERDEGADVLGETMTALAEAIDQINQTKEVDR